MNKKSNIKRVKLKINSLHNDVFKKLTEEELTEIRGGCGDGVAEPGSVLFEATFSGLT